MVTATRGAAQGTMEAVVLTDYGKVENKSVPVPPAPVGDQVLLRVTRAGICGSELEAVHTKSPRRVPPLIMGHEFAGRIEALGPDAVAAGWKAGERVVPNPLVPCLRCRTCARGLSNACPNRTLLGLHVNGGHAQWVTCSARQLHRLPDGVSDEAAATAEPLAVGIHALRLLGDAAVLPRAIAVFGAGTIGLLALQAAQLAGATATMVLDVDRERLEVAKRLGATLVLDPRSPEGQGERLIDAAKELSGGDGLDGALDCVGRGETRAAALKMVQPGSTVVWVGKAQDEVTVGGEEVINNEKRIQGTYAYTGEDFATAVSLLISGKVDVLSWSKTFPMSEGADLIGKLISHKEHTIKVLLDPDK